MLKAVIETEPRARIVKLSGTLDDGIPLAQVFGPASDRLMNVVDCGGITRVNSTGVKGWILFFRGLASSGCEVTFVNCSPVIVEQLNVFHGFQASGRVASVQLPFCCKKDPRHQFTITADTMEVRDHDFKIGNEACPTCGSPSEFDDNPTDYFAFMNLDGV